MAEEWNTPPFDDISTSDTVSAAQLNVFGNNLRYLELIAETTLNGDASITGTSVGAATSIATLGSFTYEAVPHRLEFYHPRVDVGVAQNYLILRDVSTVYGTLARFSANGVYSPVYFAYVFTPTAASHNFNVAAWNQSASTTTYRAGSGGTAGDATTDLFGYLRMYRAVP